MQSPFNPSTVFPLAITLAGLVFLMGYRETDFKMTLTADKNQAAEPA